MLTMCCYLLLCLNVCWLICSVECVNDCVCGTSKTATCFLVFQSQATHNDSTWITRYQSPCGITSQTYQCPGSDIWSVDISRMLDPKYHPWYGGFMGFPYMRVPQNGWFIMENPNQKWMIWRYPQEISAVCCCPTAMSQLSAPCSKPIPSPRVFAIET